MPTIINGKVTYASGEALPPVGSQAYVDAQNGKISTSTADGTGTPISDAEVAALQKQGYQEGDNVPGRGVLMPDGTFRSPSSAAGAALGASTGMSTAGKGIVASSGSVVANENATKATVANLSAPDPNLTAVQNASDNYMKLLKEQQAQLEARRQADLTGIGAQFDEAKRQAGIQQAKETATTSTALQRIGGYLGGSASAIGALNNLAQTHQQEIATLEAKRAAAVQAANTAIDDKQFALAGEMAKEAKQVAQDIADRRDKFFSQSMQLVQEQRQQDEYLGNKYQDQLKNLAFVDPSKINPDDLKQIDDYYGISGFAKNYIDVTSKANAAKSQKEIMDARKSTLEFLQNIPAGQKITMPDGTAYTGIGKAGDVSTFLQVDSAGIGHVITVNKLTGAQSISNVGAVGKSSGAGGSGAASIAKTDPIVIDNATALFQTQLEQSKDKDGYYDPDTYIRVRNQLKESRYPQLIQYMDKLFLNKANGYFSDPAINQLRKKGIYYGDTSLPGDPSDNADTSSVTQGD